MDRNAELIKSRIIAALEHRGPALPIELAREAQLEMIFAGAFLSELLQDQTIKMSTLRVGSSPAYYLPKHEAQLEKYATYLKSKEKEAYAILKEKKVLKDIEQLPAIRVALRAIKDFAKPFEKEGELYWKYFTAEDESTPIKTKDTEKITITKEIEVVKKDEGDISEIEKPLFEEVKSKKSEKGKKTKKSEDPFLEKIRKFLQEKAITIEDIVRVNKIEIILKVKKDENLAMLVAYNKKKMTEKEIIAAWESVEGFNLPYYILLAGEVSKKMTDLKTACKKLHGIHGIK